MQENQYSSLAASDNLRQRGIDLIYFDEIDSTNAEARRMAEQGKNTPALIVADRQSAGRGRMGRSFFSPVGTGIYMSLLIEVKSDELPAAVSLTSAAAVAVIRATDKYTGKKTLIKWVNDILLDGKKVCGILAESFTAHGKSYVCIGIGINTSTKDFPDDISNIAGSVNTSDRASICESVCCELYDLYLEILASDKSYIEEYRSRSAVIGREITYIQNGKSTNAIALDIDGDGALTVKHSDGTEARLFSGEISLRIK